MASLPKNCREPLKDIGDFDGSLVLELVPGSVVLVRAFVDNVQIDGSDGPVAGNIVVVVVVARRTRLVLVWVRFCMDGSLVYSCL